MGRERGGRFTKKRSERPNEEVESQGLNCNPNSSGVREGGLLIATKVGESSLEPLRPLNEGQGGGVLERSQAKGGVRSKTSNYEWGRDFITELGVEGFHN